VIRFGRLIRLLLTLSALVYLSAAFFHDWLLRPSCHCSFTGSISTESPDYALIERLRSHVNFFATRIGERSSRTPEAIRQAVHYVRENWSDPDHADRVNQKDSDNGSTVLWIDHKGNTLPNETVLVTAHINSPVGSAGANASASGVATLIELSRALKNAQLKRTVRLIAFTSPLTSDGLKAFSHDLVSSQETVKLAVSLGSLGQFTDEKQSQHFPVPQSWMYPHEGNFIQVVGFLNDVRSRGMVNVATQLIGEASTVPVTCHKSWHTLRNDYTDDLIAFVAAGYPAIEITDTGSYRSNFIQSFQDTANRIDYPRFSEVVRGIVHAVEGIANDPGPSGAPNIG
jgi:hypothetical protein